MRFTYLYTCPLPRFLLYSLIFTSVLPHPHPSLSPVSLSVCTALNNVCETMETKFGVLAHMCVMRLCVYVCGSRNQVNVPFSLWCLFVQHSMVWATQWKPNKVLASIVCNEYACMRAIRLLISMLLCFRPQTPYSLICTSPFRPFIPRYPWFTVCLYSIH